MGTADGRFRPDDTDLCSRCGVNGPALTEELYALQAKVKELKEVLKQIAAVAHEGGLIGFTETNDAMITIRKLSLDYWEDRYKERDNK